MIGNPKRLGDVLDELLQNRRRLAIAHFCLGLASAIVYWLSPGSFRPHLPIYSFRDASPIYLTFIAWFPYAISFFVSRSILAGRSTKAVFVFIFCAVSICLTSASLRLHVISIVTTLSPIVVSGGVAVTLVIIAWLCSMLWR
jgi:hypothetical protein